MLIANPMHTTGAAIDEMVRGVFAKDWVVSEIGQHHLALVILRADRVLRIKELLGTLVACLMGDKFVGADLLVRV